MKLLIRDFLTLARRITRNMKTHRSIRHDLGSHMVPVPQRKDVKEIRIVSADVECKCCVDLDTAVKGVTMHELGFWLSVKRNKMEAANITLKVHQRNSVTKAVGSETLLECLQFDGHR